MFENFEILIHYVGPETSSVQLRTPNSWISFTKCGKSLIIPLTLSVFWQNKSVSSDFHQVSSVNIEVINLCISYFGESKQTYDNHI